MLLCVVGRAYKIVLARLTILVHNVFVLCMRCRLYTSVCIGITFLCKNKKTFPPFAKTCPNLQKTKKLQKPQKPKTLPQRFLRFSKTSAESFRFLRFLWFLVFLQCLERFLQMVDRFFRFLQGSVMVLEAYSEKPLRFLTETTQT